MNDVSVEAVQRLAATARLNLNADELERLREDLSRIIGYVQTLRELDISEVEPTSHVLGLTDVLRDDQPGDCLDRDVALSQSANADGRHFVVQAVLPGTDT
jgi:aspartyl-tRNA(Asn)/glutamyl-tRNA(Gln) amidotransferase subunit C